MKKKKRKVYPSDKILCMCGATMWRGTIMCRACRSKIGYYNRITRLIAFQAELDGRNLRELESLKENNSILKRLITCFELNK